ncbi:hypothetical protein [Streptomyces sp. NPDC002276]
MGKEATVVVAAPLRESAGMEGRRDGLAVRLRTAASGNRGAWPG